MTRRYMDNIEGSRACALETSDIRKQIDIVLCRYTSTSSSRVYALHTTTVLKIKETLLKKSRNEAGEDKESYRFPMDDVLDKHNWERE